jgi:hypothetical protein
MLEGSDWIDAFWILGAGEPLGYLCAAQAAFAVDLARKMLILAPQYDGRRSWVRVCYASG